MNETSQGLTSLLGSRSQDVHLVVLERHIQRRHAVMVPILVPVLVLRTVPAQGWTPVDGVPGTFGPHGYTPLQAPNQTPIQGAQCLEKPAPPAYL